MTTRRIKGNWYVDFRFQNKRYRKKSQLNSQQGAMEYGTLLIQRLMRGEPVEAVPEPGQERFAVFSAKWVKKAVDGKDALSEQIAKQLHLRKHLVPAFGKLALVEITAERLDDYVAYKRSKGYSPKTINNHLATLSGCLRAAWRWGALSELPFIPFQELRRPPFDFYTAEEGLLLLNAAEEPFWHRMILTAMRTGMRRGELFAFSWEDISFERRMITIRQNLVNKVLKTPKNGEVRHIPMTDDLFAALLVGRQRSGYVFTLENGLPLNESRIIGPLKEACARAQLRPITWHILRHSFASQLVMAGVDLRVVMELMGHHSLTMTLRYAHLAPSALYPAMRTLSEYTRQQQEFRYGHPVGNGTFVMPSAFLLQNPTFPQNQNKNTHPYG